MKCLERTSAEKKREPEEKRVKKSEEKGDHKKGT